MKQYVQELMYLHQIEGDCVIDGGRNSIELSIPQNMVKIVLPPSHLCTILSATSCNKILGVVVS